MKPSVPIPPQTGQTLNVHLTDSGPDQSTIERIADRLDQARRDGTATPPVRDVLGSTDVATAYAVQAELTRRRLAAGRSITGRKIGLTSPAVQQQLGVDQPDFGVLFDDMAVSDGGEIPTRTLIQPKAEAEVAFVLGSDLDGDPRDLTYERAADAIDHAVGALEIVDSRNANWDITITDTVADNASSGLYVLGATAVPLAAFRPVDVTMALTKDGREVSSGSGSACLGDPISALLWLARTVAGLGVPLRAGEVVLSGALGPMVPVEPGSRVVAELSTLVRVSVSFAE
jgi:2-keto-4-pentenoate hydratase